MFSKRVQKKYIDNRIFFWMLVITAFFQFIYLSIASSNVPLMDYWRYIEMFVEKMNTGGLSFSDIWKNDGIHRSPLQFVYFICNVRFFHMNARVEIFLGEIVLFVLCIILYRTFVKDCCIKNTFLKGIFGSVIVIIIHNLNQYELINEQFALSFASRMTFFLLSFIITNSYLKNTSEYKKYTFEVGLFFILVLTSVGAGYFPAYILAIVVEIVFGWIDKREKKEQIAWRNIVFLLVCLLLGLFIYFYGMTGTVTQSIEGNWNIGELIYQLIIGSFSMLGVCILGNNISIRMASIAGCILAVVYLYSIIIYVKRKYYHVTVLPMALYSYSLGCMGLVFIGRAGTFGIDYAFSSRYVCETNVALIGLWLIAGISIEETFKTVKDYKLVVKEKKIVIGIAILLGVCILHSDINEWKTAPFRKQYGEQLIENIYNINELEDEDFIPFQAREQDVRNGIEIMKKYHLGIFYYNE